MSEPKTSTMTKLFHADTLEDLKSASKESKSLLYKVYQSF